MLEIFDDVIILLTWSTSLQNQSSSSEQFITNRTVPREIIILGSALTILGVADYRFRISHV